MSSFFQESPQNGDDYLERERLEVGQETSLRGLPIVLIGGRVVKATPQDKTLILRT